MFMKNLCGNLMSLLGIYHQPVSASSKTPEGYWKKESAVIQNDLPPSTVQPHFLKPAVVPSTHGNFLNQQSTAFSQGSSSLYPASYLVSHSHPSSFQTVVQPTEQIDPRKASKLQIPTNPRIASNLSLGQQKTDKDSYMTSPAPKPAYISVSMQTPDVKVTPHDGGDSSIKVSLFLLFSCKLHYVPAFVHEQKLKYMSLTWKLLLYTLSMMTLKNYF